MTDISPNINISKYIHLEKGILSPHTDIPTDIQVVQITQGCEGRFENRRPENRPCKNGLRLNFQTGVQSTQINITVNVQPMTAGGGSDTYVSTKVENIVSRTCPGSLTVGSAQQGNTVNSQFTGKINISTDIKTVQGVVGPDSNISSKGV